MPAEVRVHGRDCVKAPHFTHIMGYGHAANYDGPYDVDGVTYCGRCHVYITRPAEPLPEIAHHENPPAKQWLDMRPGCEYQLQRNGLVIGRLWMDETEALHLERATDGRL